MIDTFSGEYSFLSNFYPCAILYNGIRFPSVEHAFQAQKTTLPSEQQAIANLKTPAQAKKAGRRVKCRRDWDDVKVGIMRELLMIKFTYHGDLTALLLGTNDDQLVEGNWWGDRFWGVCHGEGENMLGKLLMEVRDSIGSANAIR